MPETESFWALRTCLHLPIPEYEAAAELLSEAADAMLTGDLELARHLVRRADMAVLFNHGFVVMTGRDPRIQRKRPIKVSAGKATKVAARMPPAMVENAVFARDGWRCRFCGCRVVSRKARAAMSAALPGAIPWNKSDNKYSHGAFYTMSASLDHVVPHSAGGTNNEDNLVTACWTCQFGRGDLLLEEVGLLDPRARPPVRDSWDGLGRLLARVLTPAAVAPVVHSLSPKRSLLSRAEWFASLEAIHPTSSGCLVHLLEACADLNVSWHLNKVLIVRMTSGKVALDFLGVQPDGRVEIPWAIAGRKKAFRGFAETIAAAISGAVVYETPKHWVVSKAGKRRLNVMELLEATDTLRPALQLLHSTLLVE